METAMAEPVELLHRVHVTDHKVECNTCHEPIRHTSHEDSSRDPLDCFSCHENRHSGILDMYSGRGATGVLDLPSPMYRVQVGCNGCHTVATPIDRSKREFSGSSMVAVKAACKACHGSGYGDMIAIWKTEIDTALARAQRGLTGIRAGLGTSPSPGDQRIIELADRNIRFVRFSVPVHNRDYALSILDRVVENLEKVSTNSKQR
jgi:hypothetical protein